LRLACGDAVARELLRLRRDVSDERLLGKLAPDALSGEATVSADRGELGAGEAGARDERHKRVALETAGTLAAAGDDAACLRIDGDLAAVDEMRALAGLAPQASVRVGARDTRCVRAAACRRQPRARFGQGELRRRRLTPLGLALRLRPGKSDQARQTAGAGCVSIGVAVDSRRERGV